MRQVLTGIGFVRAVLLGMVLVVGGASRAQAQQLDCTGIIFVHGFAGSGAQFESQAMRFASNGIPNGCVRTVEYNSLIIQMIMPQVLMQIDAAAADLMQATGRDQVNLVGHSLGTAISQAYLSTPARAANIANYVNADGATPMTPLPVPTLALFAGAARDLQGQIPGATNVTLADQEHVEAVTSQAAFVEMFRFFTGNDPAANGAITPANGTFPVSGRTVIFPNNTPVATSDNPVVLAFELDPATAQRTGQMMGMFAMPVASRPVDANGFFDSFPASAGVPMELVLMRDVIGSQFFFKPEGFLREDNLLRLLTVGGVGTGVDAFINRAPEGQALVFQRFREFRGDANDPATRAPAGTNDSLLISTLTGSTEVVTAASSECCFVGSPVALIVQDEGGDGVGGPPMTDAVPFLSIVDVFIPASPTFFPTTIRMVQRGDVANAQTLTIRSIPSDVAAVSVLLNDFQQ